MNKSMLKNVAWIIKHRPKSLNDMVGVEAKQIQKYIESGNIPHLLFNSRTPGTGKSSLAKVIINELQTDYLEINSSMDRSIDNIRNNVKQFVSTLNSKQGVKKIVFLDEADGLLSTVQNSLRNLMETFAHNVIFILTCNYIDKIIDPIKNRCVVINFTGTDKQEIYGYLSKICEIENLEYTEKGLYKLIDIYYPSIRNMVNELQKNKTLGIIVNEDNIKKTEEVFDELWDKIKNKQVLKVRKEVYENNIDVELILNHFWTKTYTDNSLTPNQIVRLVKCLSETDYRISVGSDKKIQIDYLLFEIHRGLFK